MRQFVLLLMICLFVGCNNPGSLPGKVSDAMIGTSEDTLVFVPLDGVAVEKTASYAKEVCGILKELFPDYKFRCDILDADRIPNTCLNDAKTRFRAVKVMDWLKARSSKHKTIIGVTNKDISTTIHGVDDYGILGLSYRPGKVCINSTYRVKDKSMMHKLILHEFLHSKGFKHCPDDEPKCYMKDAKGKPNLKAQNGLCSTCSKTPIN